ncbi:MAG: IPT/TIG domain-containing protein [Myxococcales bacterium]|nr:IPT/TIG domain-containing protein [Myxococcales bacterium]
MRSVALLSFGLVLSCAVACSDPPQDVADTQTLPTDAGAVTDGAAAEDGQGGADVAADGATAGESVWLTFEVDDSANKTFEDGDIKWTGSFKWDSKTNEIVPAASWLPTDGPYPLLYDDGPISDGGHEKEGAKKGDHIFSVAVKFKATEAVTFEYGALNEFDNWMWLGTNGQLKVDKGATGIIDAKGLVLPKHGTIDLKLELDTAKLNEKFKTWTTKSHKFYAKGTMNMWTPVQLLDDGKKGDAKAADEKLTYLHSGNLGKHDGLLTEKDEVQFIFVTTTGDAFPDAGQEYKAATQAYSEGVKAWTNTGADGAWVEAKVELRVDSKGKFKNTSIIVPAAAAAPKCDPVCKAGETCTDGKCIKDSPKTCDPVCQTGETCTDGKCIKDSPKTCDPVCKTGQTCTDGKCIDDKPKVCTPACKSTELCTDGKCVAKTCNPGCGGDQKCIVDVCVDLPAITKVEPIKGPMAGGTNATVTGKGFAAPAKVWFGGAEATNVVVKSATVITCTTPAGTPGTVKVEVAIAGDKASKADGFTYDKAPKPTALLVAPLTFAVEEKAAIKGLKSIIKVPTLSQTPGPTKGLKVEFGHGPAASDPAKKPTDSKDAWTWFDAKFSNENTAKGEETWTADFPALPLGSYSFTVRATFMGAVVYGDTNGSEDGADPKKMGAIQVTKPDTKPTVTGLEPPWVSVLGGKVTILGKFLTKDTVVVAQSQVPYKPITGTNVTVVAGKGISVSLEGMPPRPATLTVTPKGFPAIVLKDGLDVVPVFTPKLDGNPAMPKWHPFTILDNNGGVASEWSATNNVSQVFGAYDKDNLYLGISGTVEGKNAIVAYIDTDYGSATGVKSPLDIKDTNGALDNALSNPLKVTDSKFGAEFAMGTIGMKSFLSGKPAESTSAGWRSLSKPGDLSWLGGQVIAQAGKGIEASLPLKTLFPKGIPAKGATVALFVKVVNATGSVAPKGAIVPKQTATDAVTVDTVVKIRVYPVL